MSRRECNDGMRADYRTKRNAMFPMPGGSVCDGSARLSVAVSGASEGARSSWARRAGEMGMQICRCVMW